MNPVAGESDDQVNVLHGTHSVPRGPALGPIGQDGGSKRKSSGTYAVGNLLETMYPI